MVLCPRKETFIICNPLMSHNEYFSGLRNNRGLSQTTSFISSVKKNITNAILDGYNNTKTYYLKQKLCEKTSVLLSNQLIISYDLVVKYASIRAYRYGNSGKF